MDVLILLGVFASGGVGAVAGRLLRLPMWPLTGSIVGAAVFRLSIDHTIDLPWWWIFTAQVTIGVMVGTRLTPAVVREFRQLLRPGLAIVVAIIGAGIGVGLLLAATGLVGRGEAIFGMVPGGVGEMVAAVAGMGGDSALVAGMHLVRILLGITVLSWIVKWARGRYGGPTDAEE